MRHQKSSDSSDSSDHEENFDQSNKENQTQLDSPRGTPNNTTLTVDTRNHTSAFDSQSPGGPELTQPAYTSNQLLSNNAKSISPRNQAKKRFRGTPSYASSPRSPLSPTKRGLGLSNHKAPSSPLRFTKKKPATVKKSLAQKRSKLLHSTNTHLSTTNKTIIDFMKACNDIHEKLNGDITEFLDEMIHLERISQHALKSLETLATTHHCGYNLSIRRVTASKTLAYALIQYHTPDLISFTSHIEAQLTMSSCRMIFTLLKGITDLVEKKSLSTGFIQESINKSISDFIIELSQVNEETFPLLNNYPERVREHHNHQLMSLLARNMTHKKLIENSPALRDREIYKKISEQSELITADLEKTINAFEQKQLDEAMQSISKSEAGYLEKPNIQRTHEIAIDPRALLNQFSSDMYTSLKTPLLLELLPKESNNRLLFKSLTLLRGELKDVLPRSKHEELQERFSVPELVAAIASEEKGAFDLFKIKFNYIFGLLSSLMNPIEKSKLNKKTSFLHSQASCIRDFRIIIPDAIITALDAVNIIEKERCKAHIERRPEKIRQDFIARETQAYATLIQNSNFSYDATNLWLTHIFKHSDTYYLDPLQKHSDKGGHHLFLSGLASIITGTSINRDLLPDTLFMDYRRLLNMQSIYHAFNQKLASYHTTLALLSDASVPLDIDVLQKIQSIINVSVETHSQDTTLIAKNIADLINMELKDIFPKETKLSDFLSMLNIILQNHLNDEHPVHTLIKTRTTQIVKHKLTRGALDLSILRLDNINILANQFSDQMNNIILHLSNNNLHIHSVIYSSIANSLQLNSLISKITRQHSRPSSPVHSFMHDLSDQCMALSLVLSKIALLATCMSITQQFANNLLDDADRPVTEEDIAAHIKETRADILFKRRNYTHDQIVQHIKDYRSLPLLSAPTLSTKNLANHIKKHNITPLTEDPTIQPEVLIAVFILKLKSLFTNNHMPFSQDIHQRLASQLKSIILTDHTGFKVYKTACADIAFKFSLSNTFEGGNTRKWASLAPMNKQLEKLCIDIKEFTIETKKRANDLDSNSQFAMVPTNLKTGFKM